MLPNFIIIGAARSGTTALYYYLMQHPQIYMSPVKETDFFALERDTDPKDYWLDDQGWVRKWIERKKRRSEIFSDLAAYSSLFEDVTDEKAIGEASPSYLDGLGVPESIKHYIPEARLVAILRHPVDRAYSHFSKFRGRVSKSLVGDFIEALRAEKTNLNERQGSQLHHLLRVGLYHTHLKRYYDAFARDQIKVCLYDDFVVDPVAVVQDIYRFLGVDSSFVPDVRTRMNASGTPKSKTLHKFLLGHKRLKATLKKVFPCRLTGRLAKFQNSLVNRNLVRTTLSREQRKELTQRYYREDILRLQDLIQVDLSKWLQ